MLSDRCLSCPVSLVCNVGVLWTNGWTDQDETWHASKPRPWPHCVRLGPSSLPKKGGEAPSPIFGPCPLWPNCRMDQDGTWHGGGPNWCRLHSARWGPSSLPQKGTEPPNFCPISIVAKQLDASKCRLVCR